MNNRILPANPAKIGTDVKIVRQSDDTTAIAKFNPDGTISDKEFTILLATDMHVDRDNKLIYKEEGGAWAFDRSSYGTMFDSDVDYVIFYLYDSPDADKNDYLGAFIMKVDINKPDEGGAAIVGYVSLLDGTNVQSILRGHPKDYYAVANDELVSVMRGALGSNYNGSQSYYYACQKVSCNEAYTDSDISDISTAAIKF